jgi:amidase
LIGWKGDSLKWTLSQVDLNKYISGLVKVPTGVKNLADIIAFNIEHASEELIPPFYADQSQ